MTHKERVHELLYSCDSRTELCERIATLEDLAVEMYAVAKAYYLSTGTADDLRDLHQWMKELGIKER